jgi:RNA polymerase sigma-70 factor (ECF subfamily)
VPEHRGVAGISLFLRGIAWFFIQTGACWCLLCGGKHLTGMDNGVFEESDWRQRLYDEKAAELLLYGRALGLGESEAEDVLQETFVALLKMKEPPDNPVHYGVRAFRNRALNFKRGLWRRVSRELESARWFEQTGGATDLEEDAQRALAKLPPEQREVIVLKIWHEMTYDEIAGVLDVSPNTAAGRFRYGMQKLKGILKGPDYERLDRGNDESLEAAPALPGVAQPNLCV